MRVNVWRRLSLPVVLLLVAFLGLASTQGTQSPSLAHFDIPNSNVQGATYVSPPQAPIAGQDDPVPGYYSGSNAENLAVIRIVSGQYQWHIQGMNTVTYGTVGDIPAPGDYCYFGENQDYDQVAVFRPSDGTWHFMDPINGQTTSFSYGTNGDVPDPADYAGNGCDQAALFRPSNNTFYVKNIGNYTNPNYSGTSVGDFYEVSAGELSQFQETCSQSLLIYPNCPDWVPMVPELYDGTLSYNVTFALNGSLTPTHIYHFGTANDIGISFDYGSFWQQKGCLNGDQYGSSPLTSQSVWRPSNGTWYVKDWTDTSPALIQTYQYGQNGDIPVPGHYTSGALASNDNCSTDFPQPYNPASVADRAWTTPAVYRPCNGTWYIRGVGNTAYGLPYGTCP